MSVLSREFLFTARAFPRSGFLRIHAFYFLLLRNLVVVSASLRLQFCAAPSVLFTHLPGWVFGAEILAGYGIGAG